MTLRPMATKAGGSVYPGSRRDMWVYTPAGHDFTGSAPAAAPALMVFQDGGGYLARATTGHRVISLQVALLYTENP